jgi:hypothetical protein
MYKVKRIEGKVPPVLKNTYASYDDARREVRKWILVQLKKGRWGIRDGLDLINRTVTIGLYGFSVKKM